MLANLSAAAHSAVINAAGLIPPDATIATCSYSSAMIRVFESVRNEGKDLDVLVFEPTAGRDTPGHRLADELARLGLDVGIVGNTTLVEAIGNTKAALAGGDAVTPVFVVNGTPSLALVQAARGSACRSKWCARQ